MVTNLISAILLLRNQLSHCTSTQYPRRIEDWWWDCDKNRQEMKRETLHIAARLWVGSSASERRLCWGRVRIMYLIIRADGLFLYNAYINDIRKQLENNTSVIKYYDDFNVNKI
jgi:hypothetical protein